MHLAPFKRHLQAALQEQVQQQAACRILSGKRDSQMFAIGSIELRTVSATCTRVDTWKALALSPLMCCCSTHGTD